MSEDGCYFRATTLDELLEAKLGCALELKDLNFQGMRLIVKQCTSLLIQIGDMAMESDDGQISSFELVELITPVVEKVHDQLGLMHEHSESMLPHFEKIDRLANEALERRRLERERGQ